MGMDLEGIRPTSEAGRAGFDKNIWSWHPLAAYCQKVAPEICAPCKYWHSNDSDGLDADGSLKLATALKVELSAGATLKYETAYREAQAATPDTVCDWCDGTGEMHGRACRRCRGKGSVRPSSTYRHFSVRNVEEFVLFLKGCGGFKIR